MLNVVWKSGHQSKPIHCIHLDWIVQCSSIWCYLFKQKYFSYGKQRIVVYRNLFSKCPSSCLSTLCKTSFKTSILLKVNPTLHRGAHYGPPINFEASQLQRPTGSFSLVQSSDKFGHMGTNYDHDPKNIVWAMQVVTKWSQTACVK